MTQDKDVNMYCHSIDDIAIKPMPSTYQTCIYRFPLVGRMNPQFMRVFVTGRVNIPGGVTLPQGSSLNQAISLAGGTKLLKGRIEFVRFNREGTIDRRLFAYNPRAATAARNNPILAAGDLIRVHESILSGSINVLNELTSPFIGVYTVYSLFDNN